MAKQVAMDYTVMNKLVDGFTAMDTVQLALVKANLQATLVRLAQVELSSNSLHTRLIGNLSIFIANIERAQALCKNTVDDVKQALNDHKLGQSDARQLFDYEDGYGRRRNA